MREGVLKNDKIIFFLHKGYTGGHTFTLSHLCPVTVEITTFLRCEFGVSKV